MIELKPPISEVEIRKLKVGDVVSISGTILTARDAAHKYIVEKWLDSEPTGEDAELKKILEPLIRGGIIYHCGPVVKREADGKWKIVAAGPTTSIREEPYQHRLIAELGLRAVIGKGGMGDQTLEACKKYGAVYLHAVGGAATLIAEQIKEVEAVYKLEFGLPEAFWQLRVENFQCVVTMDSSGESLHKKVLRESEEKFKELLNLQ